MAKFSFVKGLWKTRDPEWVKDREEKWHMASCLLGERNKSRAQSYKKYFMKGEWTEGSRYYPLAHFFYLFSPNQNVKYFRLILEEITGNESKEYFRKMVLASLITLKYSRHITLDAEEFTALCVESIDGLTSFSDEKLVLGNYSVSRFPFSKLEQGSCDFFWMYVRGVNEWLEEKNSHGASGFEFFLTFWFESNKTLTFEYFPAEFYQSDLLKLFTLIHHYIPHHNSNSGAQEKARFVKDFHRLANDMGFSNDLVASTWKLAQESKEDEWVDHLYQCTKDEDSYAWDSSDFALFTNLVYRSKVYQGDMVDAIYQRYAKNGFIADGHVFNQSYIDVTELLTQDFIAELAVSNSKAILGRLTRLELSEKFMGTSKVSFSLDIIAIDCKGNHEREVPRILIIERPTDFYVAADARRYCANRQFMVDDIKAETGIELVRYFGFDQNPILERTYPPRPQDYLEYEKEMERPFYNASYLPLKTGSTAFILNDENEYVVVPDRPTIL